MGRFCLFLVLLAIFSVYSTNGWEESYQSYTSCYEVRMDERMPLSVDNLIAILEAYEKEYSNTEPEIVAQAILKRYRKSGVVFYPQNANFPWARHEDNEVLKQYLDDTLIKSNVDVPQDIFHPREECSLHMMMSHSTDTFPHSGVNDMWDDYSSSADDYSRKRRASSTYQYSQYGVDEAEHPIENGVIQTTGGPVAAGILLAGLATMSETSSYTVGDLLGRDNIDYMADEMKNKKINNFFGATIAGELAQAAVLTGRAAEGQQFEVGPAGRFGNSTCCARLFSLANNQVSDLSRAELFAGMDALIIAGIMRGSKQAKRPLPLSEVLRMYYSDHGLYSRSYKACNRMGIFKAFQGRNEAQKQIYEEALNYMYALQHSYLDLRDYVARTEFSEVEMKFRIYLDEVMNTVKNFIRGYGYDDQGYERCGVDGFLPIDGPFTLEEETDLVVVFTPVGSSFEMQKQAEYISQTARKIGVGYHRSRVVALNGNRMQWVPPMRNRSNVADYACNVTTLTNFVSSGGNQDFHEVVDKLNEFYNNYYEIIRSDPDQTGSRSQVVLWNLPKGFDGIEEDMIRDWYLFNYTYPDVNVIFAGTSMAPINFLMMNDNDDFVADDMFVSTTSTDADEIADDIVQVIRRVPKMFVYPACDTLNNNFTETNQYNEENHVYTSHVSPNFTTLIKIPPQNFRYSEFVKLSFKDADVQVCVSRIHKIPSAEDPEGETQCGEGAFEAEEWYLCDRFPLKCDPIYISVTGNSDGTNYCNDDKCQFSNQIEFEFTHEGMICAGSTLSVSSLTLFLLLSIAVFWSMRRN